MLCAGNRRALLYPFRTNQSEIQYQSPRRRWVPTDLATLECQLHDLRGAVCLGDQINNSRQLLAAYCAGTVDLVSDMHPDMGLMSQAERAFRQTWRLKGMEVILFHLRMSRILSSPITMDVRRKARQREGHWKTRADFAG